jgi:uncharacterized membrane protein
MVKGQADKNFTKDNRLLQFHKHCLRKTIQACTTFIVIDLVLFVIISFVEMIDNNCHSHYNHNRYLRYFKTKYITKNCLHHTIGICSSIFTLLG